jgi:hypothetical protein
LTISAVYRRNSVNRKYCAWAGNAVKAGNISSAGYIGQGNIIVGATVCAAIAKAQRRSFAQCQGAAYVQFGKWRTVTNPHVLLGK